MAPVPVPDQSCCETFFSLSNHNFSCCTLCLLSPVLSVCTSKTMALSFLTLPIRWLKIIVRSPQNHLFSGMNKPISLRHMIMFSCPHLSCWPYSGGQCVYISPVIQGSKAKHSSPDAISQMLFRCKLIISFSLLLKLWSIIISKFQEEISHGGRAGSCLASASCFLCLPCCVCPDIGTSLGCWHPAPQGK